MALDRTDPALVNHVMAEHRELFRRLCDLRATFSASAPATTPMVAAVVRDLAALRRYLAEHFSREEAGGLLEESVARLPRLAEAAAAVLREHHGLLARLDAIVAKLSHDGPRAWPDAARAFEDFTHAIQTHEREENAVFQAGYVEDLGLDE